MDCIREEASAEPPLIDAEDLYQRLERFIWWRAHQLTSANTNHVLLETDDVASEMFLTLVECWEKYHQREDIDAEAMLKIVRKSCNNKCAALVLAYYTTECRSGDMYLLNFDDIHETVAEFDVEKLLESESRVSRFIGKLSKKQAEIVTAVLTMDERLIRRAHLESTRRAFVHPRAGSLPLDYRLLADALHLDYGSAKSLWYRIRRKWQEYQTKFERGD